MGKKRPHPDGEAPSNGSGEAARKRAKTNHKKHAQKAKPQTEGKESLNAIKKRARAIERLLGRENLNIPADKQNELERELAAHKQRIEEVRLKKERSKMIRKYHMVRFFERKKAMRFAKQIEKRLAKATDPEEVARLKADLHIAQVDIDYARYFPFMEPYVSLYAGSAPGEKGEKDEKGGKGEKDEKDEKDQNDQKNEKGAAAQYLRTPRPPMWAVIEKTREEGVAALERLQNRLPQKASSAKAPQKPTQDGDAPAKQQQNSSTNGAKKERKQKYSAKSKQAKSKPAKAGDKKRRESDDDESSDSNGGGFFEED